LVTWGIGAAETDGDVAALVEKVVEWFAAHPDYLINADADRDEPASPE
jgi:hypothetical protein